MLANSLFCDIVLYHKFWAIPLEQAVEYLSYLYNEFELFAIDEMLNDYIFVIAFIFLLFEFARYTIQKRVTWELVGDTITNYITLYTFIGLNVLMAATFYIAAFYYVYNNFSITHLATDGWMLLLCIVCADFVYYWEHRFMHRVGIGWATHTVHHSSPHFNMSVAYRFGPLDGIMPLFFHLPLAALGFNPIMILVAESIVQLYQTLCHTEAVGKFPRFIERVMNTPSHHRVHHASNPQYIDKNYAGIFIIWDKMFNSFEEEQEKPVYGLTKPIGSVNPVIVFFHGLARLFQQVKSAPGIKNKIGYIIQPPGWEPAESSSQNEQLKASEG